MKGTVPGTPGFQVYSVAVRGKYLPLWQRISPVSKEVCDFSGVSRLPGAESYISEPGLLTPENLRVPLFSGHSYMACVIPYALKDGDDILP